MTAGFGLAPGKGIETIQFDSGKFGRHLRAKVFPGVFAGIPHDVFAAAAASFHLPADMTQENWRELAGDGPGENVPAVPEEGGIAVIWDLDHFEDGLTDIGVVIANQTSPERAADLERYFRDEDLTAECGGGTVYLAATSKNLLARMKESCAGQSLSIRDWERGAKRGAYETAQMVVLMNPAIAFRELSLAGGGGDDEEDEPRRGRTSEANDLSSDLAHHKKARDAMQKQSAKLFSSFPIFAFAGKSDAGANMVRMKGFTVMQGGTK